MAITAQDIAKLRAQTGAGMLDCKKALDETGGDYEKALDWLRERGVAKAAKRAGKITAEGAVASYTDGNREFPAFERRDIPYLESVSVAAHCAPRDA